MEEEVIIARGDEPGTTLTWQSYQGLIQIDAQMRARASSIETQMSDPSMFPATIEYAQDLHRNIARACDRTRMNS